MNLYNKHCRAEARGKFLPRQYPAGTRKNGRVEVAFVGRWPLLKVQLYQFSLFIFLSSLLAYSDTVFPRIIAGAIINFFPLQKGAIIRRKVIKQGGRLFQILLTGSANVLVC